MANIELLMRSLSYIEDNLDSEMQTEEIAKACFASKSSLEKVFKITTKFSVHDYIIRRRVTKAARIMIQQPELSLLDIAVMFGYSSHEAFTRAFFSVWNCNPSDFKEKYGTRIVVPELFPQITGLLKMNQEGYMRKSVDISELYDFFKKRKDCYFVCADIYHLIPINEISIKAGDIALSETMKRLLDCSGEDDVVFRIGADEFAVLTNSSDINYAQDICNKITAMNNKTFDFEDKKIPLSLYTVITKVDQNTPRYNELFTNLFNQISEQKKNYK